MEFDNIQWNYNEQKAFQAIDLYFIDKKWLIDWESKFFEKELNKILDFTFLYIYNSKISKTHDNFSHKINPNSYFSILTQDCWKIFNRKTKEKEVFIYKGGLYCQDKLFIDLEQNTYYIYYVEEETKN